jgi:magnesium transporter
MIRTMQGADQTGITWIDVMAPTPEELSNLAGTYGLHAMYVEDSLDPEHLPKYERIDDATFIILRVYGERPDRTGNSIQDVTRKIAIFTRGDTVVTIHRSEQPALERLGRDHPREHNGDRCSPACFLVALAHEVLVSYDKPLDEAERSLNQFEADVFNPRTRSPDLLEIHQLKGNVGLIRRLMWLTAQVIQKFAGPQERASPMIQDLRETAESYQFYADQLLDEAQNLIAMHLAVASHRTNEVMRVLTVFSAFFLPLTFIAGVYGMNFRYMPELEQRWGYPLLVVVMVAVSLTIFVWFRRRGWLKGGVGED